MEIIGFWFLCAVVVGIVASTFGRSGFVWFLLSIVMSPLLAGILVLVLPRVGDAAVARDEAGERISPDSHVRCPDCRELVRKDARKCKHCGTALIPQ